MSEAAAFGLPDEVKGHAVHAVVTLKAGFEPSPALAEELIKHVQHEMGPIARPAKLEFSAALPKTRSGKIMRRLLSPGPRPTRRTSTLEE